MGDFMIHPGNLVPPKTEFDRLFGNYTRFVFKTLKAHYLNDTGFFAMAPDSLRNFYFFKLKENLDWFRGKVPGIHDYGTFSCFQGQLACSTVADMIMAGDFRIESKNPAHKKYMEEMINYGKVRLKLKRALPMLMACGFMMAVIDVNGKDEWSLNFVNGNRYFVEVTDEGKITAFRRLRLFENKSIDKIERGYYLVEDRWLKVIDGKERCFHKFSLYSGATACEAIGATLTPVISPNQEIMERIKHRLGVYDLNKIYELPFENHIGAVIIHASKTCVGIEDHPEFSDSLLEKAHTSLLEYDQTFTSKQKDRIMADKGVIVPDAMLPTDFGVNNPNDYRNYLEYSDYKKNGLSNVFKAIKTMTPDKQAPYFFQSDYRQADYNADLDQIKARIAADIGISASDFSSHSSLGDGGTDKTATEVYALTGISKNTISDKREFISDGLEELFRVILKYAFNDESAKCSLVFNTSESSNPQGETQDLMMQVQGGILSRKQAMKRKNPNMSEEEIEELEKEIMAEQKQDQQMQSEMMLGGNVNDYDETVVSDNPPIGNGS